MLGRPSHKAPDWNAPVKVKVMDRSIVRDDAVTSATWDAGVGSSVRMNGPCYLQFRVLKADGIQVVGLSNTDPDQNYTTVQYGFEPYGGDTFVYIVESSVFRGTTFGQWNTGTIFRIEARPGQVLYFVDNVLVYTSLVTPTFPLMIDNSFNTVGSGITDIVFAPLP